ncbi:MAG: hypothetical protein RL757_70 [Bacteroidota bacterium]|jgi:dTDP-4-dehydrorhamnose reductase
MIKVLITGAKGQLANEFRFLAFTHPYFKFILADRDTFDITKSRQMKGFFERNKDIDFCINCAAYTAVDKAESDLKAARKVNVTGAKNLAVACQKEGIKLIHISTDYVYHSEKHNKPYDEQQVVAPKGVYAKTKLSGERLVLRHCAQSLVVRTSWVYSIFGNNFVKTMLRLGKERAALSVVIDQIGSPTYARDLAQALIEVMAKIQNQTVPAADAFGQIFNYANEGVTSWYDFAAAIFEIAELKTTVSPIPSVNFPTPAKRPPFSLMDKTKFKTTFDLQIPHWRDALKRCMKELP